MAARRVARFCSQPPDGRTLPPIRPPPPLRSAMAAIPQPITKGKVDRASLAVLQGECQSRGLDSSGMRVDLIARRCAHVFPSPRLPQRRPRVQWVVLRQAPAKS